MSVFPKHFKKSLHCTYVQYCISFWNTAIKTQEFDAHSFVLIACVAVHFIFSLFPVDFRTHFRGYCLDHQGDQLFCALQGLMSCNERAALHTWGMLPKFLPQQHPTQLFLRSAPRADVHHMGPGMRRQTLLQWGRSLSTRSVVVGGFWQDQNTVA